MLGALVGVAFGWGWSAGIVFGLAISVASTVVLIRVLADNRDLHTPTGHIAVGWLVVEDLFTVLVLVLLPALFGAGRRRAADRRRWRSGSPCSRSPRWSPSPSSSAAGVIPWLLDAGRAARGRASCSR